MPIPVWLLHDEMYLAQGKGRLVTDRTLTTRAIPNAPDALVDVQVVVLAPHRPDHLLVTRALDGLDLEHRTVNNPGEAAESTRCSPAPVVVLRGSSDLLMEVRRLAPRAAVVAVAEQRDQELELLATGALEVVPSAELGPIRLGAAIQRALARHNSRHASQRVANVPGSEALLQMFAENSTEVAMAVDGSDTICWVSPNSAQLLGVEPDELIGRPALDLVHPDDVEELVLGLFDLVDVGSSMDIELRAIGPDGTEHWIEGTVRRLDGRPPTGSVFITMRDTTERRSLVMAAQEERDRLVAAQRGAGLGSFDLNLATLEITYSDELYRILGIPAGSAVDTRTYASRVHPDDLPSLEESADEALAGDRHTHHVHRIVRPDGELRWVEVRNSTPPNAPNRLCGTVLDITERQRVAHQMDHDMRHDTLTGLPNRVEVTRRLDELIAAQSKGGNPVAVAFIDLDRFKVINDGLGHAVGDKVLQEVARRLRVTASYSSVIARFGGDEFVLLEPASGAVADVLDTIRSIVASLEAPIHVGAREFMLTASVGVAVSSPLDDSDNLLQAADTAMHAAKELTGTRVVHFDDELHARSTRGLRIETDLRRALERRQFEVHYQPIVRVPDGRWIGFESLLRWHHPELGPISPEEFIPIAEATGVIVPVGRWVLDQALAQLRSWQSIPGNEDLWTAVNLSGTQLANENIPAAVSGALERSGVRPSSLHLEITESVLMERIEGSLETLHELRRAGVHLSVDDFGTGYSSLSYLKRLPVQIIKVDRTFTSGLGSDPNDTSIVRAISRLAEELGLSVLAEGVETPEQLSALDELGCRQAQGYLWSPPVPAEQITRRLTSGS